MGVGFGNFIFAQKDEIFRGFFFYLFFFFISNVFSEALIISFWQTSSLHAHFFFVLKYEILAVDNTIYC